MRRDKRLFGVLIREVVWIEAKLRGSYDDKVDHLIKIMSINGAETRPQLASLARLNPAEIYSFYYRCTEKYGRNRL